MESTIYTNARIWTGDAARPRAEAMWVAGSTVRAVGTEAEVTAAARGGVDRVDLAGRFVCPGLTDAHAHLLGLGLSLAEPRLDGARSLGEVQERLVRWLAERGPTRGDWLVGRGWDQNLWDEARFPRREDLDAVTGTLPACLSRVDGHAVWGNTAAMERAGVSAIPICRRQCNFLWTRRIGVFTGTIRPPENSKNSPNRIN